MSRRKFTKADFEALNRKTAGIYYPPGKQTRATLTTGRKPAKLPRKPPKGRS